MQDKEKDIKQSNISFWSQLMAVLANFINAERNYLSLNFIRHGVRKEVSTV